MIKLNDKVVKQGRFPDGTLALNMESSLMDDVMFEQVITWLYVYNQKPNGFIC